MGRRRQTQGIAAELESPGQDGQGGKEEGDVKRFSLGDRQKNKAPRGWRQRRRGRKGQEMSLLWDQNQHYITQTVFPGGPGGKEPACQCRRCKRCWFDPWVGKMPWRRKWQPTPASLPGKSHGQRSLVGYSPWDRKRAKHNLATKQQEHTICLNHRSFPSFAGCVRDFIEIQFISMECSQIIFQFGILRSIVFSD